MTAANVMAATDSGFDADAIRSYVQMLHDRASGVNGVFAVSVFNDGRKGTITHHRVGDVESMVSAIMSHSETRGTNVYTGLQLFRPGLPRNSRGKESDIVAVLGLVADMDSDTGKAGSMPVAASYVIETSPGNSQPVVLFGKPIAPDEAKPLAKALQAATGCDSGTGDIAHVWRIPGTLNYPNAAKIARGRASEPALVRVREPFAGEVYESNRLVEVLAPFAKPAATVADVVELTSEVDTMPLLKRLSDIARKKLQGDGKPDRSAHAARVVEQIGYEGFNLNEAVSLCRHHAGAWAERYKDGGAMEKDIVRLWNKHVAPNESEAAENAAAVEKVLQHANDNATSDDDGLPFIDPRVWQDKPVPERQWFVEGWIPHRTVTNLSGAGGSGKTEIILQLIASSSLRTQWFGYHVAEGPCLYFGAEDEADELHRRLATIVSRAGRELSDLEGVRLIPLAGSDAVLAEPDRSGNLKATTIFGKLETQVEALRPRLVVIDPSADVFGGDEINRAQVRKFVSMLRGLAIDHDCAVLLLSHPSLAGLNSGTGTSGSTAWNNSVRSRLYMEVVDNDPDARVLKVVKANYGRTGEKIAMRWDNGVYGLDSGPDPVVEKVLNKSADDVFMAVFLKLTAQGQAMGPNVGPSYAPKKISKHPDAKGYDAHKLTAAMQRLLDIGVLKIEVTGPPSRRYTQLVAASN